MSRQTPLRRREQVTFEVKHEEQLYTVSLGWKEKVFEGLPLEVFIHTDNKRSSSGVEALMRDAAILISFALQYGTPLCVLKDAITRDDKDGALTAIGSILDAIYQVTETGK